MWVYFLIAGIILLLLIGLYLFIAYMTAKGSFINPEKDAPNIPTILEQFEDSKPLHHYIYELEQEPCEDIYINSFDNIKLHARYYKYNDSNKVAILCHGFRGTGIRDFSGGFFMVKDFGFNIILIDERGHGQSDGELITMGVRERFDIRDWTKYAAKRFINSEIVLVGISMGAASVLMASDLDLPTNVKCIVADCPYSSPKAIVQKTCKYDLHIPLWIGWPTVYLGALIFYHFNLNKGDARKSVKNTKIPCLIIHGLNDQVVPQEMSLEIYNANPEIVERHTFEGAKHGLSFLVDTNRYKSICESFINKHIK